MRILKVVGLVGLQGAGKTEVAKVALSLGIPCIRMGEVVLEEIRRRGLEINEENVGKVANELREKGGKGIVARLCLPLIREKLEERGMVVVDGIRAMEEVEELRKAFGKDLVIVGIWANPSLRYSRIASRRREDDAGDYEGFIRKEKRELEWGVGNALSLADFLFINEGTLEELREKAMEFFRRLMRDEGLGGG
ncbi:MAG: dephospho-CoA kinase [Hadesarchaea archaeon]|nr:MAG: dephospho-CoA kinase [Hadesarchaea archaeon]TDA35188.1 MAG: dephospho-CoA kinase [Hadesarchaea archaeon]